MVLLSLNCTIIVLLLLNRSITVKIYWYYYQRRYTKRSPKWSKNYDGPFVITRVIPPCNYVIQKNKRSKPQVVHQDKLKIYHAPNPSNWKRTDGPQKPSATQQPPSTPEFVERPHQRENVDTRGIFDDYVDNTDPSPKRTKKRPVRFKDYVTEEPKRSAAFPLRKSTGLNAPYLRMPYAVRWTAGPNDAAKSQEYSRIQPARFLDSVM